MLKIVFCLRRLPALTLAEFQQYWLQRHAPLVREHAPILRIRRYVQSHTFCDPRIAAARGAQIKAYDGVAELWWDSIEDMVEAGATREGRAAGRALLADERNFIDLENSPIFYAHEYSIIAN